MTKTFAALVEDDNGRYFDVTVEAIDTSDARSRISYILNSDTARILQIRVIGAWSA